MTDYTVCFYLGNDILICKPDYPIPRVGDIVKLCEPDFTEEYIVKMVFFKFLKRNESLNIIDVILERNVFKVEG